MLEDEPACLIKKKESTTSIQCRSNSEIRAFLCHVSRMYEALFVSPKTQVA